MEEKENLKLPEDYKKGFNHAELVVSQFPHLLDGMQASEKEPSEYTKGFQDRVTQYEIERDSIKNFSYKELREKYGKDFDNYGMDFKDLDRDKD